MRAFAPVTALVLTLALAGSALAGGWAVTTLDSVPPDMEAGQTYSIGYTIRQHGETPINVEEFGGTTAIVVSGPGWKGLTFRGTQEGPTGHYVARVTIPAAGVWAWTVTQGPFQAQELGKFEILPAAGALPATNPAQAAGQAQSAPAPAATAPAAAAPNPYLVAALLLAISAAAVLFGSRLAAYTSRRATA